MVDSPLLISFTCPRFCEVKRECHSNCDSTCAFVLGRLFLLLTAVELCRVVCGVKFAFLLCGRRERKPEVAARELLQSFINQAIFSPIRDYHDQARNQPREENSIRSGEHLVKSSDYE